MLNYLKIVEKSFFKFFRVASLSNKIAIEQKPTENDLLDVFINREDIEKIIKTPVSLLNFYIFKSFACKINFFFIGKAIYGYGWTTFGCNNNSKKLEKI